MIQSASLPPHSHSSTGRFHPVSQTRLAAALCATLMLSGCIMHGVMVHKNGTPLGVVQGESVLLPKPGISQVLSPQDTVRVQILPLVTGGSSLVLEPYDTIKYEFSFFGGEYHILPGDELAVHFVSDPKRDVSPVVQPDGKITLPDAGEVLALGRTPAQLAEDIDAAYRDQMKQPNVSVSLTKSSLSLSASAGEAPDVLSGEAVVQDDGMVSIPKIGRVPAAGLTVAKLSENLSALASKQFETSMAVQVSRQIPMVDKEKEGLVGYDQMIMISADGRLALPELGTFAAAGNTIAQMQEEIHLALINRYKGDLTVAMEIEQSQARIIYVDGEVGHPGAYPLAPNMTVLQAVSAAGGVANTGNMHRVTLIHRDNKSDVYVYVTNLNDFINSGMKNTDLALSSQDIVVVPKTAIAVADQWIDQYVTGILPFSRNVSYSYSNGTVKSIVP
jgi:protein involved in polysaccharide export with SLBB domain